MHRFAPMITSVHRRVRLLRIAVLAWAAGTLGTVGHAATPAADAATESAVARRTEALLQQMTLLEKVGQLTLLGSGPDAENLIREGKAGAVMWTLDTALIQHLQEVAMQESRLKIPVLFGFDVVHGYKNVFPVPLAMAASWDPAMVERAQAIAAQEAAASGINWAFGPMVDIARDARWGRMVEGAGEDACLGEAMARAQVLGFQGPRLGTPGRVLASVKHFAGYGAAEGGRDYDSCYLSEVTLRNVHLRPFQAAIDAGVGSVMSAYMCLNDVPASGNAWLLQEVLRGDMGFRGFVVSDSWSVAALVAHGFARDDADAAWRGLLAGDSMDMGSTTYLKQLPPLVESGRLPVAAVDRMVREVLAIKFRLGLFEQPYGDPANRDRIFNDPAHRAATREAAQRSIVLLRNEDYTLPLAKTLRSLAVIGPLGDATEDMKGSWTVETTAAVSVLQGLRNKFPDAAIEFVRGGDMQRAYALPWDAREGKPAPALMSATAMNEEVAEAVATARRAETVVLVLGERANMSGEAASASSLALAGNQQELLEAVVATGKPVVLVLMSGRPLDISWAAQNVPAIVQAWFPGQEGGNAIADVLCGDVNPGAKLPVTWPRSTGQVPVYYGHNHTQAHEDDPLFTSRYADATSAPLYPFGYGLSYTTFSFSDLVLDRREMTAADTLRVSVTVQNTGDRAGDEVVQLYLHQRAGSAARPVRELKGFQRVTLTPGERRTVSFVVSEVELKFWSPLTRSWVVEPEAFDVWVGSNSTATLHADFRIVP